MVHVRLVHWLAVITHVVSCVGAIFAVLLYKKPECTILGVMVRRSALTLENTVEKSV